MTSPQCINKNSGLHVFLSKHRWSLKLSTVISKPYGSSKRWIVSITTGITCPVFWSQLPILSPPVHKAMIAFVRVSFKPSDKGNIPVTIQNIHIIIVSRIFPPDIVYRIPKVAAIYLTIHTQSWLTDLISICLNICLMKYAFVHALSCLCYKHSMICRDLFRDIYIYTHITDIYLFERIVSLALGKYMHDDVIKWKHFPRNWPFVRGIHRTPVNSPHKGQWRRALMFSLICVWINDWVNNREASDLRRYHAYYDVIVMNI